jgi:hypothetical protein
MIFEKDEPHSGAEMAQAPLPSAAKCGMNHFVQGLIMDDDGFR